VVQRGLQEELGLISSQSGKQLLSKEDLDPIALQELEAGLGCNYFILFIK
jgi:hypothetical protein